MAAPRGTAYLESAMRPIPPLTQLRTAGLALAAALFLGIAGRVAIHAGGRLPHGADLVALGHAAVGLGAPWLAVAWGIGASARSRLWGAVGGAVALGLGTAAWYALTIAAGGRSAVVYAVPVAAGWGVVALAAGAVFGLAGASWRDGGGVARAAGIAALAGALAGEAILLAGIWSGRAAKLVLLAEAAVAVTLLVAGRRRAPVILTVALFGVAVLAFAHGEQAVRDALRQAGWNGP